MVLTEIDIGKDFPETVTFMDKKGKVIIQVVEFEWKPLRRTQCNV